LKKNVVSTLLVVLCVMTISLTSCQIYNELYDFYTESDTPVVENGTSVPADVVSDQSQEPQKMDKDLRIVALGDSITRGYGLEQPEKDRFTTIVSEHLDKTYNNVEMTNYAVDGMTSDELLNLLLSGKAEKLKDADIVMLCIGANNVLQFATDLFFYDNTDVEGLFKAYGSFLMGDKSDMSAPEAVKNYFEKVVEYASSKEFNDKIDQGLSTLRENIPQIISYIKKVNPDAKIYYANVYSPYKGMNFTLPYVNTILPLGDLSDQNVEKINAIIDELKNANGYTVVDIYTIFKNSKERIINAGVDLSMMDLNYDPHPNKRGHSLIADEYIRIYTEEYSK